MTVSRYLMLCLALFPACAEPDDDSGTVVGNPGLTTLRIAGTAGVRLDSAEAEVSAIRWLDCDGMPTETAGGTVDLLDGAAALEVPAGTWCAVEVELAGTLEVRGVTTDAARPVSLSLNVPSVGVNARQSGTFLGFEAGDTPLLFELAYPGWFSVAELVEGPDGWSVSPNDPSHNALMTRVATASSLFEDPDADGVISEEERDAGAVASGPVRQ